jgi:ABC-type Fe3+ transport system substrate-binding protein
MEVIWPKDGTAASPIYFLAKKDARPRIDKILEFFIKGFGEIPSAQWFLPLGGPLPPTHSPENTIKWVGWDFIYDNDITVLRDELNGTFRKLVKETF